MDPFLVLGLEADATDQQIEERYLECIQKYPPDQAPELFTLHRQAYEKLRDEAGRLDNQLRYFDKTGQALTEDFPKLPRELKRQPLSQQGLRNLLHHCKEGL